jgi:hypothetical protein
MRERREKESGCFFLFWNLAQFSTHTQSVELSCYKIRRVFGRKKVFEDSSGKRALKKKKRTVIIDGGIYLEVSSSVWRNFRPIVNCNAQESRLGFILYFIFFSGYSLFVISLRIKRKHPFHNKTKNQTAKT